MKFTQLIDGYSLRTNTAQLAAGRGSYMRVFIDTSAFIALLVSSERWHKTCKEKYKEYTDKNTAFFTNILVLAEL